MSKYRAIKNHGDPYFSFISTNLQAGSQQLPENGLIAMTVEMAVHSLPKKLATGDECHPVVAFADFGKPAPAANVMAIGVSPSGRIIGTTGFGDAIGTEGGFISGTGTWHSVQMRYDSGLSIVGLTIDSLLETTDFSAGATPLMPTVSGRVMAFNGSDAITHMIVSIRSISLSFFSTLYGGSASVVYAIDNPGSVEQVATLSGAAWAAIGSSAPGWSLFPSWYNPAPYPLPWGPVPGTDPNQGYHWEVLTPYIKRVMPTTLYRKVVNAQ